MSDPADGIFCPGDEPEAYEDYTIYGDQTATWDSAHLTPGYTYYYTLTEGSSLRVTGAAEDYFQQHFIMDGPGDFHLVGGYLNLPNLSQVLGNVYVTNSHAVLMLYSSMESMSSATTLHVANGSVRFISPRRGASVALPNDVVLAGQATLEADNYSIYYGLTVSLTGDISGDGAFVKKGSGIILLSGANTYAGGTHIAAGDLEVFTDENLGAPDTAVTFGVNTGMWLNDGFVSSSRATELSGGVGYLGVRSGEASWNGDIFGEGRLEKTGSGELTLSGENTYLGGTTVSGGALAISSDANLGAPDTALTLGDGTTLRTADSFTSSDRLLTLSGAAHFDVAASTRVEWTGATAGAGELEKTGAGTLVLSGGIGHAGGAEIAGGTLEVAVASDLAGTGSTTWAGPITGLGDFVKSGSGTLVLNGVASHTGATFLRGGTLRVGAENVLSAGSALFVLNGAVVDLAGYDQTVGDLDSYDAATGQFNTSTVQLGGATLTGLTRVLNYWAGSLTGEGTFVKQGEATMIWMGANTFEGALRVDAGTLQTQAVNTLSSAASVSVGANAILDLAGHSQAIAGLSGNGVVALGSGTLTVSTAADSAHEFAGEISGAGALVKTGAGVQTLSGANSYAGGTTVNGGVLAIDADNRLGSGTLRLDGGGIRYDAAFDDLRGFELGASGAAVDTSGFDVTHSHVVSGAGQLAKIGEGALTLAGANTYAGGTTLSAGTLRAENTTAFGTGLVRVDGGMLDLNGFAIPNAIDVRGGATTGLANYAGTQIVRVDQVYSGSVGGTLVVEGGNVNTTGATFTGTATVQDGGFLSGTGTLASLTVSEGGTLAPGNSAGLLTVTGDLTLLGTTMMEIGGTARGLSFDAIDVSGSVTFGGTLQLTLIDSFVPEAGASFDLFGFESSAGEFASLLLPTLAPDLLWDTSALYSAGTLSVTAAAIPEPAASAAIAAGAMLVLIFWIRRSSARK